MPVNSADPSPADRHFFSRAVVVVPPIRDFYCTHHRFSSLGAHIVARQLSRLGVDVHYLNFPAMNRKGTCLPLPGELKYLESSMIPGETGNLSFFTSWRHFGPPMKKCAEMIVETHPDLCFFSVFAFAYSDDAIELAGEIKKKLTTVPVIAGGGGPSVFPDYYLRHSCIDYVLTGEAEVSLSAFLREILRRQPEFERVPNLAWKDGAIKRSPITAFASAGDIEIPIIKTAESSRTVTFSTSIARGCPKQCDFCSSRFVHGRPFRTAPLSALAEAVRNFPIDGNNLKKQAIINFEDDNLAADERFLTSAIMEFKKRIPDAEFIVENGIDYSFLSPRMCEWLINHGMNKFNLSLASLNPGILKKKNRMLFLERYERIIDLLVKRDIRSITYFICGFREDTLETIAHNLSYLSKKHTVIGISPFYAVPCLPGYDNLSRFEKIPSYFCLGSIAYPWNGSLSTETMVTAFRLSRYINAMKSPHRSESERELFALIADKRELFTVVKGKNNEGKIVSVPGQDRELVRLFFNARS